MRIVCISDTHERHDEIAVPAGDILIHAGDMTWQGEKKPIEDFNAWLGTLPHPHKIVVAGNHDFGLWRQPALYEPLLSNATYLCDREVTIGGLRIYGSPWTPEFGNWAFMKQRGGELEEIWQKVPEGIDILVTHGPPYGIGDRIPAGRHVGDEDLLHAIEKKRPRFHVAGHIHCGHGERSVGATKCINAAICDEAYDPVQPPVVFEITS